MSDTEYEKFEITDFDIENEFNPNKTRRRPTKNQQIYGIWADDSDDDNATTSFNMDNKRSGDNNKKKQKKNYSAPVSFVAGGIQQAGKNKNEENKNSAEEDEDNDEKYADNTSSDSEDDSKQHSINDMAGFRTTYSKDSSTFTTKGLANWEQHTKGIGAKLLLKMGYEPGKGLGKDLQGIQQPVQAHSRKGRGAIGAYGPEQGQTICGVKANKRIDEDEKESKEYKEKLSQWRKEPSTLLKNKSKRYYYKSVQDIIDKGKHSNNTLSNKLSTKLGNVTVIDMTGPEKRVLSGYHALGQTKIIDETLYEQKPTIKSSSNFSLDELMHNLNIILDMCEQEIINIDKIQRSSNERELSLKEKKENLEKIVELEENHIHTIENALTLVQSLAEPKTPLNLDAAAKIFIKLQSDYQAEYIEFGLGDLAPGIIAPLFNIHLDNWKPLEEPTKYVDLLKKWHTILVGTVTVQAQMNMFDPYSALVWSGIMPSIRSAVASWNPRIHQPMVALLDAWAPLFPSYILDNILEQLILPRVATCVDDWDPLTDTIPIHIWILPWSQLLNHKLDTLVYPIIRDKLCNALRAWSPSDRSALAMIRPWKKHFAEGDMQNFLLNSIIPKLQLTLSEFVINPLQQDLERWNQVWEWHEIIPTILMSQLLEKFFFPKWIQTLVIWLNQTSNLDQVSRWYSGWKNVLSDDVLQQTNVKEYFRRALELMHRSTGATIDKTQEQTTNSNNGQLPPSLMDLQIVPPPQLDFKELVSQKCAERGIIFAPMPGRREAGKQVYRVGKFFCYIDRSVVMISDGSFLNWQPISITALLELGFQQTVLPKSESVI